MLRAYSLLLYNLFVIELLLAIANFLITSQWI